MNNKNIGIIVIPPELLLKHLRLEGSVIDIRVTNFGGGGNVELLLVNNSMPEHHPGEVLRRFDLKDYQTW